MIEWQLTAWCTVLAAADHPALRLLVCAFVFRVHAISLLIMGLSSKFMHSCPEELWTTAMCVSGKESYIQHSNCPVRVIPLQCE